MFGPLTTKPGSSKTNKTGSWRVTKRPKFLQKNCINCKMCQLICPEGCIEGKEKNAFHAWHGRARLSHRVQVGLPYEYSGQGFGDA